MKRSFQAQHVKQDVQSWIADTAMVIGHVTMAKDASVWYHSVVRGDCASIVIGEGSNVQDLCTLHADKGYDIAIGKSVTIGHNCIIHGCRIGDNVMIGMGAIIMNGAVIGSHSIIGAGSLVLEGTVIPEYSVVVGNPARIIKQVTLQQIQMIQQNAQHYIALSKQHKGEESC